MKIELIMFIIFCLFTFFQILNLIRTKKEYKLESSKVVKVKAKVLKCEIYNTKKEEGQLEGVERKNIQELQYGTFKYENEGKEYIEKILIPYTQIGVYQPNTEVEITISKEHPETIILERFDTKLESEMIKNVIFLIISSIFVIVFGYLTFLSIGEVVPIEDRMEF